MKVLNFGSLNIDYLYPVDHIILPGETEPTGDVAVHCGGKGLNQSIALARAGVSVYHAGLVGEEGQVLLDKCAENGVKTDYIRMVSGRSGHTIIQVDRHGQNSILLFGGANRRITEAYIDEVLRGFAAGDLLILQNEINRLDRIIEIAGTKGMKIVLNPSPCDDHLRKCDLRRVSLFLLNEIEAEQLTGQREPDSALDALQRLFPDAELVLTLGASGSVWQGGGERIRQGIFPVKSIDTTAAGDTFTGYFIASMIEGLPPAEGLKLAARASAIAVTRPGAADSIPLREEVLTQES